MDEKKTAEKLDETLDQATDTPRKIPFAKRVVRQFEVRSGVQTGAANSDPVTLRTGIRTCS